MLCLLCYCVKSSSLRRCNLGSLPARKVETLQRLQNRAQLIIETARVKDNRSCDWLSVSNLISFDRLVMTYKIINKLSPESLWDKIELRSVHSKYETRNCYDLQIPRLNTKRAKMTSNTRLLNYGMICMLIYEMPQLSNASKRN